MNVSSAAISIESVKRGLRAVRGRRMSRRQGSSPAGGRRRENTSELAAALKGFVVAKESLRRRKTSTDCGSERPSDVYLPLAGRFAAFTPEQRGIVTEHPWFRNRHRESEMHQKAADMSDVLVAPRGIPFKVARVFTSPANHKSSAGSCSTTFNNAPGLPDRLPGGGGGRPFRGPPSAFLNRFRKILSRRK